MKKKRALIATTALLAATGLASAQQGPSEADLAQKVQNPIANLVSLPFQSNWNMKAGPNEKTSYNLNIQPVIPFPGEKWNIISRTIIPVNSVAGFGERFDEDDTDSVFGIGDTSLSLFWTPAETGKLMWGIGPAVLLPTASNPDVLGTAKLSLGPTAVFLMQPKSWTIGAVVSNVWSVAGSDDREDVNFLTLQYFVNFGFGKGWTIGTAPILTANWEADSGQKWTVPWGAQLSKVMRFGRRPVNLNLGYYHNATRPDGGAEGQVRFQLSLLYPLG